MRIIRVAADNYNIMRIDSVENVANVKSAQRITARTCWTWSDRSLNIQLQSLENLTPNVCMWHGYMLMRFVTAMRQQTQMANLRRLSWIVNQIESQCNHSIARVYVCVCVDECVCSSRSSVSSHPILYRIPHISVYLTLLLYTHALSG